jgi:pyruvate formate lyase activating enzyme
MFFNIQRWSLHDGPGIRTTVFFKGCPLRCRWCSNPESWSYQKQLFFMKDKCSGCGSCIVVCPAGANTLRGGELEYDRSKCVQCGYCVDICAENARELVGQDLSVDEIIRILEKDAVFYRSSGGGVTFSGGEPFAQMDVLRQLAKGCASSGIRTAVETSGFFSLPPAIDILDWIDDIFIDLKHMNDSVHQELTGVSNQTIIENIVRLDETGRRLILRIPLVKDLTDTMENIDGVVGLCSRLKNLIGLELLPYHNLGAGKYSGLNLPYEAGMAAPERDIVKSIIKRIHAHGIKTKSANSVSEQW